MRGNYLILSVYSVEADDSIMSIEDFRRTIRAALYAT